MFNFYHSLAITIDLNYLNHRSLASGVLIILSDYNPDVLCYCYWRNILAAGYWISWLPG